MEEKIYCKTNNCPYRFTCARYFYNNNFENEITVYYKEYEHTIMNCEYYIKKGENTNE